MGNPPVGPNPASLAPQRQPQPLAQPPVQPGQAGAAAGQAIPRIHTAEAPDDPRGRKRERDDGQAGGREASDEPTMKQARIEPIFDLLGNQQRAFVDAIASGDSDAVEALLRQSPGLRDELLPSPYPKQPLWTPLCHAAHHGQAAIVDLLLHHGASVNASDGTVTPLKVAAAKGHIAIIDKLFRQGADLHRLVPGMHPNLALGVAIHKGQLEASIYLIQLGVDIQQTMMVTDLDNGQKVRISALELAIQRSFTDLLRWMLDVGRLTPATVVTSTGLTVFQAAITKCTLPVIQLLIERGANLNLSATINGTHFEGIWRIAQALQRYDLIEYLLRRGLRPAGVDQGVRQLMTAYRGRGVAMLTHAPLLLGDENAAPDGLVKPEWRQHPYKLLAAVADRSWLADATQMTNADIWLEEQGLNAYFSNPFWFDRSAGEPYRASARLLGKNPWKPAAADRPVVPTRAQQLQMLVEAMSDACGDPRSFQPFSNLNLSVDGEEVMNRMVDLQRELILKAIAYVRKQFAQQVASLPDLCMNRYISLSGQVNERDLYRVLTREWGLYDPMARIALRLASEAYDRLRSLPASAMTPQFAALPPAAQLKASMVSVLNAWDKVPELVAALREAGPEEREMVDGLLYQQWRLFCDAFDVEKPRSYFLGPQRPET